MIGNRKKTQKQEEKKAGVSKTKMLLGAAGLLLFIVGVKRSYNLDDQRGTVVRDSPEGVEEAEETAR